MKHLTFVLGGCRSGKSAYAQKLAEKISDHRIYIATCVPHDDEMKDRVKKHQTDRDDTWQTMESPIDLPGAVLKASKPGSVILADCLTLWLTNLLLADNTSKHIEEHVQKLIHAIDNAKGPVIIVSNEVGQGIVPENKLARLFRDIVGSTNQKIASVSDQVIWMVAGLPITAK